MRMLSKALIPSTSVKSQIIYVGQGIVCALAGDASLHIHRYDGRRHACYGDIELDGPRIARNMSAMNRAAI